MRNRDEHGPPANANEGQCSHLSQWAPNPLQNRGKIREPSPGSHILGSVEAELHQVELVKEIPGHRGVTSSAPLKPAPL